jgi:sulfatase maturation enzyme AslB (radical SAM superfamily)
LREIKVLHLEPTDVCQAACSLCQRETDVDFDKKTQHHLDMHKITKVFDADRITQLDKMFMCGNYGDPAAGKYTLDIYREFRQLNKSIVLGMNTNGGLQNTVWWHELGRIFNQSQDYCVFSIDGLEDTNATYRQGVDWYRLMHNVEAFIAAGGSAHWDMLVYRHNQHQVDECERVAKDMGFKWFRAKVSNRPLTDQLQFPINWKPIVSNTIAVDCRALKDQSVYIDAQGNIGPCCWLGARQKDFVTDINLIPTQDSVCSATCGTTSVGTVFDQQWQKEVELC